MNKEVEFLKKTDIEKYINFINQVFEYNTTPSLVEKMIKNQKILIIKQDDLIVGSLTLYEAFEYIKGKKYYRISYFGVLKSYRRLGLASTLFDKVEEMVQKNSIDYIELTSGNQRRAAYYFYKSKDFKLKDTTVFVKIYK